jgi:hypothetical protein
MKMKIDLSRFKLKHNDGKRATLIHPDGHEFHVAVHALHPMNRKHLDSLEKHQEMNSGAASQSMPMAKGGKVEAEELKRSIPKNPVESEPLKPLEVEELKHPVPKNPVEAEHIGPPEPKKEPVDYEPMADGGEAEQPPAADSGDDNAPAPPPPPATNITINATPQQSSQQPPAPQMTGNPPAPPPATQQTDQQVPQKPTSQGLQPVQNVTPQNIPKQPIPDASVQGAYETGAQGIQAESKAEQQLARDTAIQEKAKAQSAFDMQQEFANHYKELDQEGKDLQQAVLNQHIDPNRYMSSLNTGQRLLAGIGMFFGGLGNSTALLDHINRNIDRDIDAQKAELGKKQTLFSMNLQRFNNERQAEEQTRLNMHDIAQANIAALAAKAQAPIAKAKGQQLLAQYQAQYAPLIQQAALRQTLQGATETGQKLSVDPAQLVPQMVPESARKEVLHEIGQSENARKNKIAFLQAFDNADKENSISGRIARLGFTPPSIKAMDVLGLPLIHDLEGRVNEYEQKTLQDNYPQPGDKPETVAAKRQAIIHFFDQKAAAPNAKAYGIDLDRFQSTSSQTPPAAQETERLDPKTGKVAIFDANTKKFLRYK